MKKEHAIIALLLVVGLFAIFMCRNSRDRFFIVGGGNGLAYRLDRYTGEVIAIHWNESVRVLEPKRSFFGAVLDQDERRSLEEGFSAQEELSGEALTTEAVGLGHATTENPFIGLFDAETTSP